MGGFRFPFFPRFSLCRQGRPSCGSTAAKQARKAKAFKFVFAALLQAIAFAASYTAETAAFSAADLMGIAVWASAVNAVFLLGPLLLLRSALMANIVLSLVVLGGVFTAHIVHTELYFPENRAALIAACAAAGFALFTAFRVIDERRRGGAALAAAAALGIGVVAGGRSAGGVPVSGDITNIRQVSFQKTPNLYFISFDAMAPRSLLSKYLAVETTKFHDLVEAEMRRFPNFFATSVPTSHSLNSLLALDVDAYASQRRELHKRGDDPEPFLFSGQNPSALLDILHNNGYETTSIHRNNYFGKRKGPHINHYITFEKNIICTLLGAGMRDVSFWGYCRFFYRRPVWKGMDILAAEQITRVSSNKGPQFVIAHLYAPGHTGNSFRYGNMEQFEKYRSFYIAGCEEAARYLELIIRHLEDNDPNSILLVYGDHGPFVSRGVEIDNDPKFVVQDYYGVLGGVYPPHACAPWFDEAMAHGYMTTLDAVHVILRCLSGGENALIEPRRGLHGYGPRLQDAQLDYKEFLYE